MEVHLNPCMDAQNKPSKQTVFIALSILFHILLFLFLYFLPAQPLPQEEKTVFLDLSALPPAPNLAKEQAAEKMKQIVQSERADNEKAPEQAKYLGERNQTVQEETKSKRVDIFQQGTASQKSGGKGQVLSLKDLVPNKTIAPPTQKEIDGFRKEQERVAQQDAGDGPRHQ